MAAKANDKDSTGQVVQLFVYGTLKKGHKLHEWMNGSRFVGYDTLPGHSLMDLGPYPALVKVHAASPSAFKVQGELYDMPVEHFNALKRMEEEAGYKTVEVVTRKGVHAQTFLFMELRDGIATWQSDGRRSSVVVNPDDDIPF